MTRTVTVGVDGSEPSISAAEWGACEARQRHLPLRLVHALDEPSATRGRGTRGAPDPWEAAARVVQTGLDLHYRHPDLDIAAERLPGRAPAVLGEAARDAEVLVLGTHGLGAAGGCRLGSVALRTVCAVEECPVVLVRGEPHGDDDSEEVLEEWEAGHDVVLGARPSGIGEAVVTFAFEEASRRGCTLSVVEAWDGGEGRDGGGADDPPERLARELNAELAPWRHAFPSVRVVDRVVAGSAGRRLTECAGSGLVVIGRRVGAPREGADVGPVTHTMLQHCASPLAIVAHR